MLLPAQDFEQLRRAQQKARTSTACVSRKERVLDFVAPLKHVVGPPNRVPVDLKKLRDAIILDALPNAALVLVCPR
ncbi:hypothetical protein BU14_0342s0001 [Porphyra umbilicalis]|uniref:Uncharacterized protein n=1 Tax=Porphyra umbilicalis TaxID=2786 RepID=A0A1X6NXY4_PORUM|nr:hypothetical protein BU14_0342s0001 [Porphyra umbilicalis]|eukprot:OSX73481.1 hypothetical protein BU14_0342s0001 [Porphyra umbilicalis]